MPTSSSRFVSLPPNVAQKVDDELFDTDKGITFLAVAILPMVALTALVVVSDNPLAWSSVEQ